jgi:putative serine protease PepD
MADEGDHTQGIPVDRTESWPSWQSAGSSAQPPPPAQPVHAEPAGTAGRRRGTVPLLVGALVLGALGGVGGGYAVQQVGPQDGPEVLEATVAQPAASAGGTPITAIARAALPSVVYIAVGEGSESGVGSGFVIREDGYIVTNNHVIQAAADDGATIQVEFADDQQLEAEIVGRDVDYDIAVIKVDRDGLQALQFADSDQVEVGSGVVAVGAPLGLDSTVTSGIVSALNRPVTAGDLENPSFINAIQTDAAINPGNSGGPLLDLTGQVIGVNSALARFPQSFAGGPAGNIGLGFAIPADQVERTATELIETGSSQHPVIGVLVDLAYTGEGARVLEEVPEEEVPEDEEPVEPVIEGGPADEAGIQPGEVILRIDDQRIDGSSELIVTLRSYQVGDTVEVLVRDADDEERTVSMTLQGSDQ